MILSRKQLIVGGTLCGALLLAFGALLVASLTADEHQPTERRLRVKAKRVVNGHYVKLDKDDKLAYAGIRSPYENEPFHAEAKQRNAQLVEGKKLRLRFDGQVVRDRKGRLFAYVHTEGLFINELLVREGLAYVRLSPDTPRFADVLLAAQAEARRHRRGIWSRVSKSDEQSYPADPKYGDFHRPTCEVVARINTERRIELNSKEEAFGRGFAPCNKCLP